jgi:predicted RNA-binding Zn ribbon-like protein
VTDAAPRPAFPQIAGHAALDLVDTVHWRLDPARAIDTLGSFHDVVAWCDQLGVSTTDGGPLRALALRSPDRAAEEHEKVLRLREAIYDMVFAGSETAARLVRDEHVAALARSTLEHDLSRGTWGWREPADLTGPRAVVAMLAHDLVTSDLSDARQCEDDACGWVYLDRSPRHNRIWCTAAGCGNRNRVARHHARKTQRSTQGSA